MFFCSIFVRENREIREARQNIQWLVHPAAQSLVPPYYFSTSIPILYTGKMKGANGSVHVMGTEGAAVG